jgi:hypothetical protein
LRERVEKLGASLALRIQVSSFEAICRMIEGGVGIGIIPESAARRHSRTMQLAILKLDETWAVRERSMLVRELDALPGSTRALINRANADHVTHSFLQVREGTDDVVEARGVKLNLSSIEAVESGGEPVLRFDGMAATHTNEGLTRPADPAAGTIQGDAPLVVGQGSDTFVMLGDVGGNLAEVECHAITITPGVSSARVSGVGGVEGTLGYHGVGFDGTRVEVVVPQDDAYQQEWESRTPRHILVQIGTVQGRAVGLYLPNMRLAEDPSRTTTEDLATTTLIYEAYEFEGDLVDTLAGDNLEQYRSKIQLLWSA